MGSEIVVVPALFIPLFGMIFGIVYMRNRENMAMIDRGMNPRSKKISPRPFLSLKLGLLLCGVGLGILLAFLIDHALINHNVMRKDGTTFHENFPQIYFATITLFGGLGLVISYVIEKKQWLDKNFEEKETNIKYLPSDKIVVLGKTYTHFAHQKAAQTFYCKGFGPFCRMWISSCW